MLKEERLSKHCIDRLKEGLRYDWIIASMEMTGPAKNTRLDF